MGLDVYLSEGSTESPPSWGDDAVKSAIHPEHYFTPWYLRSSYNGSGFDGVVGALVTGGTLWDIFAPCGDLNSGRVRPSKTRLHDARANALVVQKALATVEGLGAEFFGRNPFNKDPYTVHSDEDAIAAFRRVSAEHPPRDEDKVIGRNFSNIDGAFFLDDPLEVLAVIHGQGFGGYGEYLIFRRDLTWYREAIEIVIEFIDNALTMKRPRIVWSY